MLWRLLRLQKEQALDFSKCRIPHFLSPRFALVTPLKSIAIVVAAFLLMISKEMLSSIFFFDKVAAPKTQTITPQESTGAKKTKGTEPEDNEA